MRRSRKCSWHYNVCPKWGGIFIFAHGNFVQCDLNYVCKRKDIFLISSKIIELCIRYAGVTAIYLSYSSLKRKFRQFSLHCSFFRVQIIYPHAHCWTFSDVAFQRQGLSSFLYRFLFLKDAKITKTLGTVKL